MQPKSIILFFYGYILFFRRQDLRTRLLKYLLENEKNLDTISQKQIAIDLNVRAQSLSRVLKELKISELIDTKKGRIEILNKDMIMKELW